jgi:polyisoprenoid-binding protein YceI
MKLRGVIKSRTPYLLATGVVPWCLSALCLTAGWSGQLLAQGPEVYQIDTKASHIEIHVFKAGFLSSLGDNHQIALTKFSGFAELSKTQPWQAQVTAEAGSLKVEDPSASPSRRKEIQETMLGPRQLDVRRFPLITLRSLSFAPTAQEAVWRLKANLTLHGVTSPVEFSLACHMAGDHLRIQGKKMLRLRDFGIEPISRGLGAVRVKNEFEITYDVGLEFKGSGQSLGCSAGATH